MNEISFFSTSEESHVAIKGNNCNGHFNSIAAGGLGHWNGDGCPCEGNAVGANIDLIVPILLITVMAILTIIYFRELIKRD